MKKKWKQTVIFCFNLGDCIHYDIDDLRAVVRW